MSKSKEQQLKEIEALYKLASTKLNEYGDFVNLEQE